MYNNLNINEFECTLYVLFGCMYYPILQLLQMERKYIYVQNVKLNVHDQVTKYWLGDSLFN